MFSLSNRLKPIPTKRIVMVGLVAALLVLAGCSTGPTGDDGTATGTGVAEETTDADSVVDETTVMSGGVAEETTVEEASTEETEMMEGTELTGMETEMMNSTTSG